MKNVRRLYSQDCPQTIQKLGNNSYYYNYDIKSEKIPNYNQDNYELIDGYSYIQTLIQGQPNYTDCVKAVIREYLSTEEEFDLINSYNSYQANLVDNEDIATEYLEYLNLLQTIKKNIKKDFE